MTGAGRQMAGAAGAHLRVLVAELDDLGHRRMQVRPPVRHVIDLVGLRARDRRRAARRGAQLVAGDARGRLHLVADHEGPIRLLGRGSQRRCQSENEDANEFFHVLPPMLQENADQLRFISSNPPRRPISALAPIEITNRMIRSEYICGMLNRL